jgi:hypothetical protein
MGCCCTEELLDTLLLSFRFSRIAARLYIFIDWVAACF